MNPFKMTKRLNGVSKSGEILPKPVTLITAYRLPAGWYLQAFNSSSQ